MSDRRSFVKRLRSAVSAMFGSTQLSSADDGWLFRAVSAVSKTGVSVSEFSALNLSPVFACVTLIADAMMDFPVDIVRREGRSRTQVPDHPVAALLNGSANPETGGRSMRQTLQIHTLLWGNGYAEIQRRGNGDPVALWPLTPWATRPEIAFARDGSREFRYATSINGRSFKLPPDDVFHLKGWSIDGLCGISPIGVARNAIGMGLAMEEFGSKFFLNDAKSGGFVMHPGKLGPAAIRNIEGSFGPATAETPGGQGGLERAHKIKVLEEGTKFVSTTIPPEDAQFLGSREFQIAEIARIYRVPLALLQAMEKTTSWGTGIEQLRLAFVTWTLSPWVARWEEEIGRKLLTEAERAAGFTVKYNLNALLRGDMAARAGFYASGITDGWMSRNEAREKEDMEPKDGLDEMLQSANTVPMGTPPSGGDNADAI